jgi:hypothetical protein
MKSKMIIWSLMGLVMLCLMGCGRHEAKAKVEKAEQKVEAYDSIKQTVEEDYSPIVSQMELNDEVGEETVALKDSIEEAFQALMRAYPESKDVFEGERELWEKYYEAVKTVARLEDREGSSLYFYYGVLDDALTLRESSFQYLSLVHEGKKISPSKTRFTPAMIKETYRKYVGATQQYLKSDYGMSDSEWAELERAIREEEKCWNAWMGYRVDAVARMPEETGKIYKACSNRMMRTKLIQLKNQNRALGITSDEAWECRLQDDCSDEELLAYPGYDKVWEENYGEKIAENS